MHWESLLAHYRKVSENKTWELPRNELMQHLYQSCPPKMRQAIEEREPKFRSESTTPEQRRVFLDGLKRCADHAIGACRRTLGSSRATAPAQAPASPPPEPPTPAWALKTTAPAPAESGPNGVVEYEEFESVPHTASTPNPLRYDLPTNLFLEPQLTALDVRPGDVVTVVFKQRHRRRSTSTAKTRRVSAAVRRDREAQGAAQPRVEQPQAQRGPRPDAWERRVEPGGRAAPRDGVRIRRGREPSGVHGARPRRRRARRAPRLHLGPPPRRRRRVSSIFRQAPPARPAAERRGGRGRGAGRGRLESR